MAADGGNLGAVPNPPHSTSKAYLSGGSAPVRSSSVSGSSEAACCAAAPSADVSRSAMPVTSSRFVRHTSSIAASTWRNAGMFMRGSGGKYVPP